MPFKAPGMIREQPCFIGVGMTISSHPDLSIKGGENEKADYSTEIYPSPSAIACPVELVQKLMNTFTIPVGSSLVRK
jgi:hypothetical protein